MIYARQRQGCPGIFVLLPPTKVTDIDKTLFVCLFVLLCFVLGNLCIMNISPYLFVKIKNIWGISFPMLM